MPALILAIQTGLPRTIDEPGRESWTTGMFKHTVSGPVWLGHGQITGDGQADLVHHGGPDKAVNVYPIEHLRHWEQALGIGPLATGAFGENFTTEGMLERDVCIGDVYRIGSARVQVSQPRQPCWKLARRWQRPDLAMLVQHSGRTGWYLRVLQEGEATAGDQFELIERPHPAWPVAEANTVMHLRKDDRDAARALAACAALSGSWREKLVRRARAAGPEDEAARLGNTSG
jgi:MOSC domain-containing protein YiiM